VRPAQHGPERGRNGNHEDESITPLQPLTRAPCRSGIPKDTAAIRRPFPGSGRRAAIRGAPDRVSGKASCPVTAGAQSGALARDRPPAQTVSTVRPAGRFKIETLPSRYLCQSQYSRADDTFAAFPGLGAAVTS
jgi:hypothetical protein